METRTKTRVATSEKASSTPDKRRVICPLTFAATYDEQRHEAVGENYSSNWNSTTVLRGSSVVGCWKSAPQLQLTAAGKRILEQGGYSALRTNTMTDILNENRTQGPPYEHHIAVNPKGEPQWRAHSIDFYTELEKQKKEGKVEWSEKAYYYSQEEGERACKSYIKYILTGRVKANRGSWERKFVHLAKEWFGEEKALTFEELTERYPNVYGSKTKAPDSKPTSSSTQSDIVYRISDLFAELVEPTDDEIRQAAAEVNEEAPEETKRETVTAGRSAIQPLSVLRPDADDDDDDHEITVIRLCDEEYGPLELHNNDCISFKGTDREIHTMYLVELEEVDLEMFLEANKDYEINGQKYRVELD